MTTPLASVIALCTLACGSAQPGRRSTDTALVAPALVACKRDAADAWYTVGTLTFESADYEQAVYAFKRAFTAEIDDARSRSTCCRSARRIASCESAAKLCSSTSAI